MERFLDRHEAGKLLASTLSEYSESINTQVLALPRGGVPVAYEISRKLKLPLDIFIVRKLGVPGHEELAMGAIASSGVRVLNQEIINYFEISKNQLEAVIQKERDELKRRDKVYRAKRTNPVIKGKNIILVDDGLATGATMKAAIIAIKKEFPSRLILAVPVASSSSCNEFKPLVDDIICFISPDNFGSVGQWYLNFEQTSDNEVIELMGLSEKISEGG